jgi:hypothetical protein
MACAAENSEKAVTMSADSADSGHPVTDEPTAPPPNSASDGTNTKRVVGRPWLPGQSGNPGGRKKIEPRVRRYARRYDRRMIKVLVALAEDQKQGPDERRKAAMDVIATGNGRPATTQELVGRPDAPLVNINLASMGAADALRYYTAHPELPAEDAAALVEYIRSGPDPTPAPAQRAAEHQVIDASPIPNSGSAVIASPAAPSAAPDAPAVAEPTPVPVDPRVEPPADDGLDVWRKLGAPPDPEPNYPRAIPPGMKPIEGAMPTPEAIRAAFRRR